MKYLEVVADSGDTDTIKAIAEKYEARDFRRVAVCEDGKQMVRLLVSDDKFQKVLDALQKQMSGQEDYRIVALPVEITLPLPSQEERKVEDAAAAARETLYKEVEKNARLDLNFMVLVFLSTMVALIGLIENNVAVIIGAMVIAPLLGPNLAFGLGTALGDVDLMRKSSLTNVAGLGFAILLSVVLGHLMSFELDSPELLARTHVGLDSVVLALASGAAAALSMTSGLSSVLVGVMVAVALLPPAVTFGLLLGNGNITLAISAGLLLLINLVSVNLTSKLVFFIKGIRPRNWWEKKKARRAMTIYVLVWVLTLLILVLIIFWRQQLGVAVS